MPTISGLNQPVTSILTLAGSRNVTAWSISEIEAMLEPNILKWVAEHNVHDKSLDELHALLKKGRQELGVMPWHPFTALMQAYAGAAMVAEGIPERISAIPTETYKRVAWIVTSRSLEMFKHTYGDVHRIYAHANHDGEYKEVGWLILTIDTTAVFASWSYATERLVNNLTNSYIKDPDTQEPIATVSRLSKWQEYVAKDGNIYLPAIHHPAPRKPRVRIKAAKPEPQMQQMELPLVVKQPEKGLPDERAGVRRLLISMFKGVCTTANFSDGIKEPDPNGCRPIWTEAMEDCRVRDLTDTLRAALDEYDKTLSDAVIDEHIPEKVLVACSTISDMLPPKLAALTAKWLEQLQETAVKRS